jgi:hypothetical protein
MRCTIALLLGPVGIIATVLNPFLGNTPLYYHVLKMAPKLDLH